MGECHSTARRCAVIAAAAVAFLAAVRNASAEINCPKLADQLVIVPTSGPIAFQLDVFDLGDGTVNIFQYPQGGILEQTGPTPLDFVFVPQSDFRGTTTFTYRLTPPVGCPRSVQLGRVTLAGGTAGSVAEGDATTASGLVEPPPDPTFLEVVGGALIGHVCGLSFVPMTLCTFGAMLSARWLRRRPRRPGTGIG